MYKKISTVPVCTGTGEIIIGGLKPMEMLDPDKRKEQSSFFFIEKTQLFYMSSE